MRVRKIPGFRHETAAEARIFKFPPMIWNLMTISSVNYFQTAVPQFIGHRVRLFLELPHLRAGSTQSAGGPTSHRPRMRATIGFSGPPIFSRNSSHSPGLRLPLMLSTSAWKLSIIHIVSLISLGAPLEEQALILLRRACSMSSTGI